MRTAAMDESALDLGIDRLVAVAHMKDVAQQFGEAEFLMSHAR